jgi:hypothetical protein
LNKVIAKDWELLASFLTARFVGDAQKRRTGKMQTLEILMFGGCI